MHLGEVIRIDVLPDDVLLDIFDFYMKMHTPIFKEGIEAWKSLVLMCRRWRNLILESPRRLDLRLVCTPKAPRAIIDIWPALHLIIEGHAAMTPSGKDNIIVALGQSNRIRKIIFWGLAYWEVEDVLAPMLVPFPELIDLVLVSEGESVPVIPDSFLPVGGFAPRLKHFVLDGIPFPGLPKLLSSVNRLCYLELINIPHSGYFSPEAIVASLSVLSNLSTLFLHFESPQSHPDRETRSLPPPKRFILPALDYFYFQGVVSYLEDLVGDIDAPQLDMLDITFLNHDQIDFDCRRLVQFINRSPELKKRKRKRDKEAHVRFDDRSGDDALDFGTRTVRLLIPSCREPDRRLLSVAQVCSCSISSTVENLYIEHRYSQRVWNNDVIENTLWLQLLLTFTAVKDLYLHEEFAPCIASALQELVGDRITEVLPSLQNIFVEGPETSRSSSFQEKIGEFVAARQLSDHPITISTWDMGRQCW